MVGRGGWLLDRTVRSHGSIRGVLLLLAIPCAAAGVACETGSSANHPSPLQILADAEPIPLPTEGREVGLAAVSFPAQVVSTGDRFLVLDLQGDSALHLYSDLGIHLDGVGGKGQGPGEFLAPWTLVHGSLGFEGVLLYDVSNRRLTPVLFDNGRTELRVDSAGEAVIDPSLLPVDFGAWKAGRLLSATMNAGSRVVVTSPEGESMGVLLLPDSATRLPPSAAAHLAQAEIATELSGARFALARRYEAVISIHNESGMLIASADVPVVFDPQYTVSDGDDPVVRFDGTTRLAYLDVEATKDAVFALFSGRAPLTHPQREFYGDVVHVFGWDGSLIGVISLPKEAIDVHVEGGWLHTLVHDPLPAIVSYELPELSHELP